MLEETRPTGHGRARGLVSSRVSGRRVETRTFAPAASVRDVVEYYWIVRWNLVGQPPHRVEMLADPSVNLVVESGRSRIVGVSTDLFRHELADRGSIRAAKMRAGAASALLPEAPISDITNRVVPLGDIVEDAEHLEALVLQPEDDQAALLRLDAWLAQRLVRPVEPRVALAVKAVAYIAADPSVTSTRQVADHCGVTTRTLQRLFRDHVGVSPKWTIRRYRLQEAAVRLEKGEGAPLARLAAELGYSDHAHLTRDFRSATGRAPSEFGKQVWE